MFGGASFLAFLLAAITVFCRTEASNPKEIVEIITQNGAYYRADITWTLKNFLHLPTWSIQSPYFPADNKNGLKWFLIAVTNSPRDGNGDVDLMIYPLGYQEHNITNLSVDFQCAVVDAQGRRRHKKSKPRYNILDPGTTPFYFTPFLSGETLVQNQSQLLPNGHLTFECILEGFVKREQNPTTESYLTTFEWRHPEISSDCGKDIAESTMRKLRADGYQLQSDITLTASNKKYKGHRQILLPLLSKMDSINATHLNFNNVLDDGELEDLLSFMYKGKAPNLLDNCFKLYMTAKQYGLSCLQKICEDALIANVPKRDLSQLLGYAEATGAVPLKKAVLNCIAKGEC